MTVKGVRLAGAGPVALLTHRLVATPIEVQVTPNTSGTAFDLELPDDAAAQTAFAPGLWQLSMRVTPAGDQAATAETNGIALPLAPDPVIAADPVLGLPAVSVVRGGSPLQVTVTLRSRPQVRLGQRATLTLDAITAEAAPRAAAADPLVFVFPNSLPDGNRWVRLRVDSIDSPLVLRNLPMPEFDPTQKLTVPA